MSQIKRSLENALDQARIPWVQRASRLIAARVADARVHAEVGNLDAAANRLIELRVGLVGHTPDHPGGLIRDARAAFYRQAFRDHRPFLDPAIHQMEMGPSPEGAMAARLTPIGGRDDWHDTISLTSQAMSELRIAAGISQIADTPLEVRTAAFAGWELRNRDRLTRHAAGTISDNQMALHHTVGHILVKPEFRGDD